jgi:hypothetical protein
MLAFDITPFLGLGWWFDVFEAYPVKIFHTFARRTSQVLVRGQVCIKSGLVIEGRYSGNEPAILKGQEGPIDSI